MTLKIPCVRHLGFSTVAMLVALPFLILPAHAEGINHTYFPMQDQNFWCYDRAPSLSGTTYDRQSGSEILISRFDREMHGLEIYRIQNYFFDTGSTALEARFCNDNQSQTQLMYEDPRLSDEMEVYYPWDLRAQFTLPAIAGPCVAGTTGQFSTSGTATVPAGTFRNTITANYSTGLCGCAGLVSETFAPNIGLIRRTVLSFAGEVTWELTSASVNGVLYYPGRPKLSSYANGALTSGQAQLEPSTWGKVKDSFGP